MFGLSPADIAALAAYLVGVTALGVWMGRRVHNTSDFFLGGRRFGKVLMVFFGFGTGTHSDQAVSVVAKTYTAGMSGIWYQWLYLPVTPFNWWMGPIFRRARATTTADYYEARYGPRIAGLYAVVGVLQLMVSIGVMLKGTGAVLIAVAGITDPAQQAVAEYWAIGIVTALFVLYGVAGGLGAAVLTDFIQGLLTILLSFILLPYALKAVGGFTGLHAALPDDAFRLVAPGEIGLFYIVMITINALIGAGTQPHAMPCYGAGKTEVEAQLQGVGGYMIKRVCTVAWVLTGLCAIVLYPGLKEAAIIDQSFGRIARDLLPAAGPGLLGVFIASLLASVMSSCDAFMLTSSALFTENVYRPLRERGRVRLAVGGVALLAIAAAALAARETGVLEGAIAGRFLRLRDAAAVAGFAGVVVIIIAATMRRPGATLRLSEAHRVAVGRLASIGVVVGGLFIAFRLETVIHGVELFWKVAAMMGVPFWLGLFWRRATAPAAWASTFSAFATWYVTSMPRFAEWAAAAAPFLVSPVDPKSIYLPWQMLVYLTVGATTMVVVSLLTRPKAHGELDPFYAVFRTPIQPGERLEAPCRLPPNIEAAPPRKLINRPNWEIQRPTAWGIWGFVVTWVVVILLVAGVALLMRVGR
jgi:Na+/proline symporter